MSLKKYIDLTIRMVRYNLKIIFAGKFFWFLLAAFAFFAFFMFQQAWNRAEINEGSIYNLLLFPCLLLISIRSCSVFKTMKTTEYWKSFLVYPITALKCGACAC